MLQMQSQTPFSENMNTFYYNSWIYEEFCFLFFLEKKNCGSLKTNKMEEFGKRLSEYFPLSNQYFSDDFVNGTVALEA